VQEEGKTRKLHLHHVEELLSMSHPSSQHVSFHKKYYFILGIFVDGHDAPTFLLGNFLYKHSLHQMVPERIKDETLILLFIPSFLLSG